MNAARRPGPSSSRQTDPAASTSEERLWRPSLAYLVIALGLAGGGLVFLFFLWLLATGPAGTGELAGQPAASMTAAAASMSVQAAPQQALAGKPAASAMASRLSEGNADPTRDLSSYVMRGEKPTMPEVIQRLHKAGVHEGLGAFQPPGTRPPMIGLAVPEDFVLPDGYVRHHQATDDGQRIEAILMFAPDRQFFDASGKPIAIPANRVVPPEYAPPGMPIRRIVLPKPIDPTTVH